MGLTAVEGSARPREGKWLKGDVYVDGFACEVVDEKRSRRKASATRPSAGCPAIVAAGASVEEKRAVDAEERPPKGR